MEEIVLNLVLTELFTVSFKTEIVNDDNVEYPGSDYTNNLSEPIVITTAAGVCKEWYKRAQALRTVVLLQAVEHVHYCMIESILNLADIDMYDTNVPPETRVRFAVHLGTREMYMEEAVLSTIEPTDNGVPIKLVVHPCFHSFLGVQSKTFRERNIKVHQVCLVHENIRGDAEDKELDAWRTATCKLLRCMHQFWKSVITYRLHVNILNCSKCEIEQHLK
jgi:hypothetical protein